MLSKHAFLLLSALSIPLLPSCKSETYESGAATGETIRNAADGIDRGITTLDATMASLKDLVENPGADLGPQYKAFAKNVETLDKQAAEVRELATKMEEKGKAYFAQWDQQIASIANEDIKERSQERRKEVDEALEGMKKNYAEAREQFRPLLADLQMQHQRAIVARISQAVDARHRRDHDHVLAFHQR